MEVIPLDIPDVRIVRARKIGDARGFFSELYHADRFREAGLPDRFAQDNVSRTQSKGVVRGMHWQNPPAAQAKLVRCQRGRILDVAVDLRRTSSTYGHHVAIELASDEPGFWDQLYVPEGFAHGFCTLTEDCEVMYKVSAPYAPHLEAGLRWDDPALGIAWPLLIDPAGLLPRDLAWPRFDDLVSPF